MIEPEEWAGSGNETRWLTWNCLNMALAEVPSLPERRLEVAVDGRSNSSELLLE